MKKFIRSHQALRVGATALILASTSVTLTACGGGSYKAFQKEGTTCEFLVIKKKEIAIFDGCEDMRASVEAIENKKLDENAPYVDDYGTIETENRVDWGGGISDEIYISEREVQIDGKRYIDFNDENMTYDRNNEIEIRKERGDY